MLGGQEVYKIHFIHIHQIIGYVSSASNQNLTVQIAIFGVDSVLGENLDQGNSKRKSNTPGYPGGSYFGNFNNSFVV